MSVRGAVRNVCMFILLAIPPFMGLSALACLHAVYVDGNVIAHAPDNWPAARQEVLYMLEGSYSMLTFIGVVSLVGTAAGLLALAMGSPASALDALRNVLMRKRSIPEDPK